MLPQVPGASACFQAHGSWCNAALHVGAGQHACVAGACSPQAPCPPWLHVTTCMEGPHALEGCPSSESGAAMSDCLAVRTLPGWLQGAYLLEPASYTR